MLRLTFLLCLMAYGLCYGQQTSPMELLFQEQQPLRKLVKANPEAQKHFKRFQLKIIGGTVVGSSGVLLLNHSLGSISARNPHQWALTGMGVGLIGAGLLITKGAKEKRHKALEILQNKKAISIQWQPTGLRISF